MNKNITRVIPSESLKGSKVNEFGNPTSDTRKKKPTFVDGKFNGEIYEVGKKYQQAYTERNTFEPVDRVVSTSIKRLEELKDEKNNILAFDSGYIKSRTAIIDANITTLLAAIILFFMGSGPIKGFSVTLGIGIFTTLFSVYFIARLFTSIYVSKNRNKEKLI